MNPVVATRMLGEATGLSGVGLHDLVEDVRLLAAYKYDAYDGYQPGGQFIESLTRWLLQFQPDERPTALAFVRERVVFISRRELHHLIGSVYRSVIRTAALRKASACTGVPSHRITALAATREFAALHRATLIVGLSDGADLGTLRRLSPALHHDQFLAAPDISDDGLAAMVSALLRDLAAADLPAVGCFRSVVLVDDFSATGATLLRREDGCWRGRLTVTNRFLASLVQRGALSREHDVHLVLYVATDRSVERLDSLLSEYGLPWSVHAVQRIGEEARVTPERRPDMHALCARYADGTSVEYVPSDRGPLAFGCGGAALSVVLQHNTPDNSISLLWQNRREDRSDRPVIPLFPRHERYP